MTRGLRAHALYIAAALLPQATGVVFLPILVATLSSDDFSRFGLLASAIALLAPLLSLNGHTSVARLAFDRGPGQERASLMKTALLLALLTATLTGGLLLLGHGLGGWTDPIFGGRVGPAAALLIVVLAVVTTQWGATVSRAEHRPASVIRINGAQALGVAGTYIALIPVVPNGLTRLLVAYAIGNLLAASFATAHHKSVLRTGHFQPQFGRHIIRFSAPTVVTVVAIWIITSSGRWVGSALLPLDALAPYILASQLVLVTGTISRSLFDSPLPRVASSFARGDAVAANAALRESATLAISILAAGYTVLAVLVLNPRFALPAALSLTPVQVGLAFAASLFDVFTVTSAFKLYHSKLTRVQAKVSILAAVGTLPVTALLADWYGIDGLFAALVSGYGIQAGLLYRAGAKATKASLGTGDR